MHAFLACRSVRGRKRGLRPRQVGPVSRKNIPQILDRAYLCVLKADNIMASGPPGNFTIRAFRRSYFDFLFRSDFALAPFGEGFAHL